MAFWSTSSVCSQRPSSGSSLSIRRVSLRSRSQAWLTSSSRPRSSPDRKTSNQRWSWTVVLPITGLSDESLPGVWPFYQALVEDAPYFPYFPYFQPSYRSGRADEEDELHFLCDSFAWRKPEKTQKRTDVFL